MVEAKDGIEWATPYIITSKNNMGGGTFIKHVEGNDKVGSCGMNLSLKENTWWLYESE